LIDWLVGWCQYLRAVVILDWEELLREVLGGLLLMALCSFCGALWLGWKRGWEWAVKFVKTVNPGARQPVRRLKANDKANMERVEKMRVERLEKMGFNAAGLAKQEPVMPFFRATGPHVEEYRFDEDGDEEEMKMLLRDSLRPNNIENIQRWENGIKLNGIYKTQGNFAVKMLRYVNGVWVGMALNDAKNVKAGQKVPYGEVNSDTIRVVGPDWRLVKEITP
jgi:hypothetical protein